MYECIGIRQNFSLVEVLKSRINVLRGRVEMYANDIMRMCLRKDCWKFSL